jgi:hypothetical protein
VRAALLISPPEPNHPKYATSPSAGSISTISIDLTSSVSRNRKFADSPLEGDGFEPSVPVAGEPVYIAEGELRVDRRGSQKNLAGYRWFESISLQRGVSNEASAPMMAKLARFAIIPAAKAAA